MTCRHWASAKVILVLIALSGCGKVHSDQTLGLRDPRDAVAGGAGSAAQKTKRTTHPPVDAGSSDATQGVTTPPAANDAATAEPDPAGMTDAPSAGDGGSANDAAAPGAAPEVWIGQLRSTEPALCDPNPQPAGKLFVADPAGYTERALLVLRRDQAAGVSGQIQFGDSAALKALRVPDDRNPDTAAVWKCTVTQPTRGFAYTLIAPVLTDERLTFAITPNEVWNTWCTTQLGPCTDPGCNALASASCDCTAGTCRASQNVQIMILLAVTSDTIEGELSFGGLGSPADMRLRRVQ